MMRLRAKLRDTATIHAAIATTRSTRANLQLQRQIAALTWVLLALTVLTALFAALAVDDELRKTWNRLW